jgi:hypothetical protein
MCKRKILASVANVGAVIAPLQETGDLSSQRGGIQEFAHRSLTSVSSVAAT